MKSRLFPFAVAALFLGLFAAPAWAHGGNDSHGTGGSRPAIVRVSVDWCAQFNATGCAVETVPSNGDGVDLYTKTGNAWTYSETGLTGHQAGGLNNGAYIFYHLHPGSYRLCLTEPYDQYYPLSANYAGSGDPAIGVVAYPSPDVDNGVLCYVVTTAPGGSYSVEFRRGPRE